MPHILGAHMSIAGGLHQAVLAAADAGCDCVQLFTGNPRAFPTAISGDPRRARPIAEDDAARFRQALDEHEIGHPLSHAAYLVNLATADAELRRKSIDAMVVELVRAEQLGISYVVMHPGAYVEGNEQAGLRRIVAALDTIHHRTRNLDATILLETTAGQGTSLGCAFEHLAEILASVERPDRLDVCIDTCHLFAAGYPLAPKRQHQATMRQFDRLIGLDRIKAVHLNDSKRPLGSRVDRHEHIGRGEMGVEPFRHLLADRRLRRVPMYLETPKGKHRGRCWDQINLRKLRSLV